MLGAAMWGRCVEEHCIVVHSVGGCGDGSRCEKMVYVNNVVESFLVGTV